MEDGEPLVQRALAARLPVELLTEIINIIAYDPIYDCRGQYLPIDSITISQVCRLWRDVALGSGGKLLWTRAPLRHNDVCVHAFMERSHPLPVSLAIELGAAGVSTTLVSLAAAVTHMDRVEEISFEAIYDETTNFNSEAEDQLRDRVYELLSDCPAPSLKKLTWSFVLDICDEPLSLPTKLFAGRVPDKLRYVRMISTAMTSQNIVLRAPLTSLELGHCMASWDSVDDLLNMLSRMPGLERFIFDNSIYPIVDNYQPSQIYTQRSVNLPYLCTLSFSPGDTPLTLSRIIFGYLHIPVNARVHLVAVINEETQQEDVTLLCDALAAHYHDNNLPDGQKFTFSAISIGLCGLNTDGLILHASHRNSTCLSLVLAEVPRRDRSGRAVMSEIVQSVLSLPITSRTTRFNIKHSNWFAMGRAADWTPLRSCMPELETICISRTALHGLAPVLLAPAQLDNTFPNLNRLYFEGLTFDKGGIAAAFFFVVLTRIAHHRAAHGHPLECILFRVCSGAAKLAEQLAVALPDVEIVHRRGSPDKRLIARKESQWDNGDADIPYPY
ncbi:hypothetical protein PENSPDRAFT_648970 [Peniophora sp. CONT]|nr:hypothetical protein PENSPDRAFT_648970 [Peniophora sp. CONT]